MNWSPDRPLTPAAVLQLQRTIGNRRIVGLLRPGADIARQESATAESTGLQPPAKNASASAANVQALERWLNAHVAGHALAAHTYTFYEVIDTYLGPWGASGYPINYGKRYNVLFTTNQTLMANNTTRTWVWRTTIFLQEALVTFILGRFRAGTLARLTEPELRAAAFASHPHAYTQGGLALVALTAPELIPTITTIPGAEFSPTSPNIGATISQVVSTAGMVIPRTLGNLIAAAMPAHSGSLVRAHQRDQSAFRAMIQLNQYLAGIRRGIEGGQLNSIRTLDGITNELLRHQYPDQGFARAANEVIRLANERKRTLARQFQAEIQRNASLRAVYNRTQPGWEQWLNR